MVGIALTSVHTYKMLLLCRSTLLLVVLAATAELLRVLLLFMRLIARYGLIVVQV